MDELTCRTCAYLKSFGGIFGKQESLYCLHPMNASRVTGTGNGAFDARKAEGVCGPRGDLHSARHVQAGAQRGVQ